jgi:hypothetical protein
MKPEHKAELLAYAVPIAVLIMVLVARACEG